MNRINNIALIEPIKAGGTANLFLGVDLFSGFPVAVKELKPGFFKSELVREKFLEEANRYLYLEHPNIVKLRDFIDQGDRQFLVMEFIDGNDLSDYVSKISGPLPLYNVALIFNEVLSAMQYVHSKDLIHLDLKPSNIMLTNQDKVKIIDFGISHAISNGDVKSIMGSPIYMSPEQVLGEKIDHRSDIYSLGITMFEIMTGKRPFGECQTREELFEAIKHKNLPYIEPLFNTDKEFSYEINEIIQKATAKNPNDRYKSCEELQIDLLQFL